MAASCAFCDKQSNHKLRFHIFQTSCCNNCYVKHKRSQKCNWPNCSKYEFKKNYRGNRIYCGACNLKYRKTDVDEMQLLESLLNKKDSPNVRFRNLEVCFKASTATIYKCIDNGSGKIVCIKAMSFENSLDHLKRINDEIIFLKRLKNPNILTIIDAFKSENVWIVTEYATTSLFEVVQKEFITPVNFATICKNILNGISYIHNLQIIHRDIKSENILLFSNGGIKIADFGIWYACS